MSAWSRTVKPSADTTKSPTNIVGADVAEVAATPGIASPGWQHVRTVGTRKIIETLVAMKNPPVETADDSVLPDYGVVITAQPAAASVAAPAAASFTVAAATAPTGGAVTYQWQSATSLNGTYSAVANGGVYSGATSATLAISNSTGLTGRYFRCVVSGPAGTGAVDKTSAPALLTVA